MNWLLVIAVLVILYLCRGKKKVLVSGVIIGLILCWFMGSGLVEGFDLRNDDDRKNFYDQCCGDGGVYNGSIAGCEATNPNGDELISGGEAAAEGMCMAMFQIKEKEQDGEAGYQAGRVARIEAAKQTAREACCPTGSDVLDCFGALNTVMEDTPELGLQDLRFGDFDVVKRKIECPNMD